MTIPSHIKSLLCLLLLAWADPALACSCKPSTPQQHMQRHALIFSGTVEAVDHKAGRARFRVHTLYKGEADGDTIEINYSNAPGASCGTEFTVGTVPTVFAYSVKGGPGTGSLTTGRCSMIVYASTALAYQPVLDAYRVAVSEARAGTSQEPGSIKAWLVLAELQERNRDYLAAARTFERLQALAPREAAYATRQGSALFELGRYGQALGAYQRALAIAPNDEAAKRGREQSMVELGRVAELDPSRRDYSGVALPPSNFAGRELSGVRFVKASLTDATFAQARLAGADFSEAVLNDTDFKQAELRGARFNRITSYGANFSAADLSDTSFMGGKLFRVRFDGANLSNADLSGASLEDVSFVRAKLAGMRLSGANLYRANLSGNDLTGMDLSGLQMQGVILAGAKLVNVDLRNAVLSGPRQGIGKAPDLRGTDLTGAKLQGADLSYALFDCRTQWPADFDPASQLLIPMPSPGCPRAPQTTKLFERPGELREWPGKEGEQRAKIRGPAIDRQDLSGIDLTGANLSGFRLWGVNLQHAQLRGVDLRNASLVQSDLRGANLTGADLRGASVDAADLSTADLTGANLTGAIYSLRTRWPVGIDPKSTGAVLHYSRVPNYVPD